MPVHFVMRARSSDPEVVGCDECGHIVTVIQPGERARCGRCGQSVCADCVQRRRHGESTVAYPLEPGAQNKDEQFARSVLQRAGLSEEYNAIVAERITRPGADLSKSDQEYLALVKRDHSISGPWIKTPWSKAN